MFDCRVAFSAAAACNCLILSSNSFFNLFTSAVTCVSSFFRSHVFWVSSSIFFSRPEIIADAVRAASSPSFFVFMATSCHSSASLCIAINSDSSFAFFSSNTLISSAALFCVVVRVSINAASFCSSSALVAVCISVFTWCSCVRARLVCSNVSFCAWSSLCVTDHNFVWASHSRLVFRATSSHSSASFLLASISARSFAMTSSVSAFILTTISLVNAASLCKDCFVISNVAISFSKSVVRAAACLANSSP